MDYDELVAEFENIGLTSRKLIELPENIWKPEEYFFNEHDRVLLSSGKTVCICRRWSLSSMVDKKIWEKFRRHMKGHGYPITQYRLVNLEDNEHRLWKYCRRFGFVSAGGKSGADIKKLQQGDLLFVFRVGTNVEKRFKGCVACGRVISANAVDVWDIPTPNGKLKNAKLEDGQTYHNKFSDNNKNTDKAVSVEWIPPFQDDEPIRITGGRRGVCISKIQDSGFKKLISTFNIRPAHTEE